jgi:tRNA (mo5U34)-methyltransferase
VTAAPARSAPHPDLAARIAELGPWFHNMELGGVLTAPEHFLGDYPAFKYQRFAHALPTDLKGKSVLDIGCNAGFYAMEMARRGAARVVGIDSDPRYLAQAQLAAEALGFADRIELRQIDVYDVGALGERFDVVIFMGVLYHLRHPLLALDLIHEHVADDLLLFQSLQAGSDEMFQAEPDYEFHANLGVFDEPGWPKLHFIEHRYAGDPTNWWVPNAAASAAMLRSAGFEILDQPISDVFMCRRQEKPSAVPGAVYPAGEVLRD